MRVITVAIFLAASASVAAQPPPRDPPLVPEPLTWGMDDDRAMKALEKLKMSPRYGETHGYFGAPAGTPTGAPVSHTIEPSINFVPRIGWTAEAKLDWSTTDLAFRIQSVTFRAPLAATVIRAELTALERRFGKPTKIDGTQRIWVRNGVWLVMFEGTADPKTKLTPVYVSYRRDARPAP